MMLVAAVAGGYLGARLARRVNPRQVRSFIVIVSIAVTAAFFFRH
jgi:uncharacterized membrane protein YfcA